MLSSIAAFAVLALAVVVMPGADTILVLRTSLRDGIRAGLITAAGVVCGPVVWGTLAGLGVALVLSRNALLFLAVAAAGGLYLGTLGCRALLAARAAWRSEPAAVIEDAALPARPRRAAGVFGTGLLTNLLNPKIGVFYVSLMPGLFLGQQITAWLGALLGAIHAVLGLLFLSGVAALSGVARRFLTRPRPRAGVDLACGLCLLGFAIWIVVEAALRSQAVG